MIVFSLVCPNDHVFEAWFPSGDAYDAQVQTGAVACPICGDVQVRKAPMAPRIARHRGGDAAEPSAAAPSAAEPPTAEPSAAERPAPGTAAVAGPAVPTGPAAEAWRRLAALCRRVEANTVDVGPRFAEEARRIHYGEAEARGIRGQTSEEEAAALSDEGIAFARVPWVPSDRQ